MARFLVDGIPIRVFKDNSDIGVPYLNSKPMYLYSSLWNGDSWATQGGRIKLDWSNAPFIAYFSNFNSIDACTVWNVNDTSFCSTPGTSWWETDYWNASQLGQLTWVAEKHLIYDYCTDTARFNGVTPPECWNNWH
jgi:xyloglucan:xyloglucosyl transferase